MPTHRTRVVLLTLFLAFSLIGLFSLKAGPVSAGGPGGSWASQIICTNLGNANTTTIKFTFYPQDSGTKNATEYNDTTGLAPGVSRAYFSTQAQLGLPGGFIGSGIVSSDQLLTCQLNSQIVTGGVGGAGVPARIGASEGVMSDRTGTTLYAPQLFKNLGDGTTAFWQSYLAIQNTEASSLSVTVSYKDRYGVAYPAANTTVSIPAQSVHIFYQNDVAALPNNFIGAATVTNASGGKMAGIASFYNISNSYSTSQFHSYSLFTSGANKLFVPRFVRNYYGFSGGLTIMNVGGGNTSVTIAFTIGGNAFNYPSTAINQGASLVLYAPDIAQLAGVDALTTSARYGSAVQAAGGGSIAAIVNEDNRGTCRSASCPAIPANWVGWGATYDAGVDGMQGTVVYFPQLFRHVGGTSDFSGGIQVSNTTGTGTTCDIVYTSAGAANELGVSLDPFGSISRFAPNVTNLPDGYQLGAKVTCGQPVFGISNFSGRYASYYGDSFAQSNGMGGPGLTGALSPAKYRASTPVIAGTATPVATPSRTATPVPPKVVTSTPTKGFTPMAPPTVKPQATATSNPQATATSKPPTVAPPGGATVTKPAPTPTMPQGGGAPPKK